MITLSSQSEIYKGWLELNNAVCARSCMCERESEKEMYNGNIVCVCIFVLKTLISPERIPPQMLTCKHVYQLRTEAVNDALT